MKDFIPDVQSAVDSRKIPIQKVGIRDIRYPLIWKTQSGDSHSSVGMYSMSVFLPAEQKGTHMSRFIALLEEHRGVFDLEIIRRMTKQLLVNLETTSGEIILSFPYFIHKAAPISQIKSYLDYEVTVACNVNSDDELNLTLQVMVPVTSLCPCSKEISLYGAHNQRSHVTISADLKSDVLVEDLIKIVEDQASCELFGLLKRQDEKYVTEKAYQNSKFVEDLVRDIAICLNQDDRIKAYKIEAINFESIHNHNAYALIEYEK